MQSSSLNCENRRARTQTLNVGGAARVRAAVRIAVLEQLETRRLFASLNTQYNVELQTHPVTLGFGNDHLSLLVTPQSAGAFHDADNDNRADEDPMFVERGDGSFALSLGAGPSSITGGQLIGAFNRANDIEIHTAAQRHTLTKPSTFSDSRAWVNALISRSAGYGDNLNYDFFPEDPEDGYNSNSYIAGLLAATGTSVANPSTIFTDGDYPGYLRPVPSTSFGRTPAQRIDLVFVIDTTGSMGDDIAAVKASATQVIQELSATFRVDGEHDARVAVVDYRDFPVAPYGEAGDYPFHDVQKFTSSQSKAVAGIQALSLGSGGDIPESVYSGVMHATTSPDTGSWRGTGVSKMLIVMGDAPGHDPEPFTGFTMNSVVTAAINEDPVVIFPVAIGSNATAQFTGLATGTGGKVFNSPTASGVVQAIRDAIQLFATSPIAEAGGPYTGTVNAPISLDASESFDPNGTVVKYEWDWESDGTYDLTTTTPQTQHTWTAPFNGRVRVRVTDNDNQSSFDWADVTVSSNPLQELIDRVKQLRNTGVLNAGNANALTSKLVNAQHSISVGNTNAAINQLGAFLNQVNAFKNARKLSQSLAIELTNKGNEAIDLLG